MLVEAAWAAARAPGPLRAFFIRIQSQRGTPFLCRQGSQDRCPRLASARTRTMLGHDRHCWRPSFGGWSGSPVNRRPRGTRGRVHAYKVRGVRQCESTWVKQAEGAYTPFGANWQTRPGQRRGAANRKRSIGARRGSHPSRSLPHGHPCPITIALKGKSKGRRRPYNPTTGHSLLRR